MKNILKICLAGVVVLAAARIGIAEDSCLKVAVGDGPPTPFRSALLAGIDWAVRDAGLCATYYALPTKRANRLFAFGEVDMLNLRFREFTGDDAETVLILPEPLVFVSAMIVTRNAEIARLDGLRGKRVGVVRGNGWNKAIIKTGAELYEVDNDDTLETLLIRGRVAAALMDTIALEHRPGLSDFRKITAFTSTGHLVLHRRHRDLAKTLNASLARYKAEGHAFTHLPDDIPSPEVVSYQGGDAATN